MLSIRLPVIMAALALVPGPRICPFPISLLSPLYLPLSKSLEASTGAHSQVRLQLCLPSSSVTFLGLCKLTGQTMCTKKETCCPVSNCNTWDHLVPSSTSPFPSTVYCCPLLLADSSLCPHLAQLESSPLQMHRACWSKQLLSP